MKNNISELQEQIQLNHLQADLLESQLRLEALKKLQKDKNFYKKMKAREEVETDNEQNKNK